MLWEMPVGNQESASLAYDPDRDRFLVLGQTLVGSNSCLQLIVIDAKTGGIDFIRNYEAFSGSNDQPVRVLYEPSLHDYLIVGTSVTKSGNKSETNLMVVRLTNNGDLVYSKILRRSGLLLQAADAAVLPDASNPSLVIAESVSGLIGRLSYDQQPAYTQMDIRTGQFISSHLIGRSFQVKGIVVTPGPALAIIGHEDLPYGVLTHLFHIEPLDTSFQGVLYNYNSPFSNYRLACIAKGADDGLVLSGVHRFFLPWNGSQANLDYPWLMTTDAQGEGSCSISEPLSAAASFRLHSHSSTHVAAQQFVSVAIRVTEHSGEESALSACEFAYRIPKNESISDAGIRIFPNPASDVIQIETNLNEDEKGEMVLLDSRGRILFRHELLGNAQAAAIIPVANLAAGLYVVDFRIDGQTVRKEKIMVRHD
jgi:hypothetical protein